MPKKNIKDGSLSSRSLKYKLTISFFLMIILPLLVCVYLVLQGVGFKFNMAVIIAINLVIASAGFLIIKQVFDRIVSVTREAKKLASVDGIIQKLGAGHMDEVGELGIVFNSLTQNIRDNMDELKDYGKKTTELNFEIQKRVMSLSNSLQISSLIAQGAKIDDILKAITEKSLFLFHSEISCLLYRAEGQEAFEARVMIGVGAEHLLGAKISPQDSLFYDVIKNNKPLIIDVHNRLAQNISLIFQQRFDLKNMAALPVWLRGRVIAILCVGNRRESFSYDQEDLKYLEIFAKQIAIAVENNFLNVRVDKLEIRDALTDLYNEPYIHNRLQEEIKRSIIHQRPCAYILFDIDNFKKIHENFGLLQAEAILKKIAVLIRDSVSEVDRVGRTGDDEFAVLLPEKNKRQAQAIAEKIRKRIEFVWKEEAIINKRITVSVGVSENPLDGIEADELITKARELLIFAKETGKNCVAGFK
ncbi:MAG: diguanylate cyclase [Candidatus Omnitrophota bacterium]|nr:diguanylate cyclase [Candidatus Omnitrophota bacterium]